jgi:sialate O-acetylesterase
MRGLFSLILILSFFQSIANVVLPSIFGNNMVLQQKSEVKIYGWAKPLEVINVNTSWDNKNHIDTTDNYGNWEVVITTPFYGGPFNLKIKGNNTIDLKNILVGEVWLVSGQSNMEWSASAGIDNAAEAIKSANYPSIRFLSISNSTANEVQNNFVGQWTECTPESMKDFSAVGYFFSKEIFQNTKIPIGIINSSWGGTPAEAWTPEDAILSDNVLHKDALSLKEVPWGPVKTASIYNSMIAPITKYNIAGVLWYQGESNVMNAKNYDRLLYTLATSWRAKWKINFPFYFAQIAPYKYEIIDEGVALRNAQRKAEFLIPNSAMIVLTDIGDNEDIHPRNKIDVGKRFANLALHNQYGKKEIIKSGPRLIDYEIIDDKIILNFSSIGSLICNTICKQAFEISDVNGEFKKADVTIETNKIILTSKNIKTPMNARYAWSNTATEVLTDVSNLLSSSFILKN